MKTRSGGRVDCNTSKLHVRKLKTSNLKCLKNVKPKPQQTKRKRSYKELHSVGRRSSSHFVTYSQDGRLFYDLYLREMPYNNKFQNILGNSSKNEDDGKVGLPLIRTRRRKNASHIKEDENHVHRNSANKREASLNASLKVNILCAAKSKLRVVDSKQTVALPKKPSKKSSDKPKKQLKKKRDYLIDKRLRRELGDEYCTPDIKSEKRIASLNALAMISAVTSPRIYRTMRRSITMKQTSPSTDTLPCSAQDHECPDFSDDAHTEPMQMQTETQTVQFTDPQETSITRSTLKVRSKRSSAAIVRHRNTPKRVVNNMGFAESAVESYHSQQLIPLNGGGYGIQQVTHQILCVSTASQFMTPSIATSPIQSSTSVSHACLPICINAFGSFCSSPQISTEGTFPFYFPAVTAQNQMRFLCGSSMNNGISPYTHVHPSACPTQSYIPLPGITQQSMFVPSMVANQPSVQSIYPGDNPFICHSPCAPLTVQPTVGIPLGYQPISGFSALTAPPFSSPMIFPTLHSPLIGTPLCIQGSPSTLYSTVIQSQPVFPGSVPPIQLIQPSCIDPNETSAQSFEPQASSIIRCAGSTPPSSTTLSNQFDSSAPFCLNEVSTDINCLQAPNGVNARVVESENNAVEPCKSSSISLTPDATSKSKTSSDDTLKNLKGAWEWEGAPYTKLVCFQLDSQPVTCRCYPAIRHRRDGMLIRERDNVFLCSGPDRSKLPHVAKILTLYEDQTTDTKMMSVLWYYRPENVIGSTSTYSVQNELYATRHCDINPVDCIEDKAFVLTASAYARFMAKLKYRQTCYPRRPLSHVVPPLNRIDSNSSVEYTHRRTLSEEELPETATIANVLLCRTVYDHKLRRIPRKPTFHHPSISGLKSCAANRIKGGDEDGSGIGRNDKNNHKPVSSNSGNLIPSISLYGAVYDADKNRTHSSACFSQKNNPLPIKLNCDKPSNDMINLTHEDNIHDLSSSSSTLRVDTGDADDLALHITKPVRFGATTTVRAVSPVGPVLSYPVVERASTPHGFNPNDALDRQLPLMICQPVTTTSSNTFANLAIKFGMQPINAAHSDSNCMPESASLGGGPIWPAPPSSFNISDFATPLETSADLSVNWGEHGEQIALSLNCRAIDPLITPSLRIQTDGEGFTDSNLLPEPITSPVLLYNLPADGSDFSCISQDNEHECRKEQDPSVSFSCSVSSDTAHGLDTSHLVLL